MTLRDMVEQFTIQGDFCIKEFDTEKETLEQVAFGWNFEDNISDLGSIMDQEVLYIYCKDNVLQIEVKKEECY